MQRVSFAMSRLSTATPSTHAFQLAVRPSTYPVISV
ncbi:unnamed protein product, partial [Didymodactylos carnosus]